MKTNQQRIIDSHQHFWDLDRFQYKWMPSGPSILRRNYLPEDILPEIHENNVSGTILVEAHSSDEESDLMLTWAEQYDFIAGVICWADLTSKRLTERLEILQSWKKFVGIRHQIESEPDDSWILREPVIEGLKQLARMDIPFDLVVFPRHLRFVPQLSQRIPTLKLVLDHMGKPPIVNQEFESWASDIRKIAEIPTIHCKVSGLVTEADHATWSVAQLRPYIQFVLDQFGADRLMWGSDWPVCLKAASYQEVLQAFLESVGDLNDSDQAALLGRNATTFYVLKETPGSLKESPHE